MRKMKFNHGVEVPYQFVVFGAAYRERKDEIKPTLRTYEVTHIYASFRRRRKQWHCDDCIFDDTRSFWDWLSGKLRPKRKTWVFADDLPFVLDLLGFGQLIEDGRVRLWHEYEDKKNGGKLKKYIGCVVMGGRPSFISCLLDHKSICFADLRNYFNDEALAEFERGNTAIGKVIRFPELSETDNIRLIHTANLAGLMGMMFDKWTSEDIGCWQPTAAKLAMRAYQHYVGKTASEHRHIIHYHDIPEVKELERAAYFGGEAQLFRIGRFDAKVYYVDVCAMYPHVCMTCRLPYKLVRQEKNVSVSWLESQLRHYGAIAEVVVAGPGSEFPVRIEPSKKAWYKIRKAKLTEPCVIYPEGRYGTVLCGAELEYAIKHNYVKEVGRVLLYEVDYVLRGFMEEWWNKRKSCIEKHDILGEHIVKLIMNSLVGKFGQRSPSWEPAIGEEPPVVWGEYYKVNMTQKTYHLMRSIGGYAQRYVGLRESRYSFVPIPAFVCSAGRLMMRELRRSFPPQSVLLQDTDGLIVTQTGLDYAASRPRFDQPHPGCLRLRAEASSAEFWTPKHFRFGKELYLAGIPQTQYYETPEGIIEEVSHPFMARLLLLPPGQAVRELRRFDPELLYPRRHILPDGWTEPLLIL